MVRLAILFLSAAAIVGCSTQGSRAEVSSPEWDFGAIVGDCLPPDAETFAEGSLFRKGLPEATPSGFVADGATSDRALGAVTCILEALGMPAQMRIQLEATTGVMGAQTYVDDVAGITYTWSYSGDRGLTMLAEQTVTEGAQ